MYPTRTKIFLSISTLFSLAFGNPLPHPQLSVPSTGSPGVFICPQSLWRGACTHPPASLSPFRTTCTPLPLTSAYVSFGPDLGVECNVYQDAGCVVDKNADKRLKWITQPWEEHVQRPGRGG